MKEQTIRHVRYLFLIAVTATAACNDLAGLAGTQALPSGTPNPHVYHSPAGALALYQATVAAFQYSYGSNGTPSIGSTTVSANVGAFVDAMLTGGLMSDELTADTACGGGLVGCPGDQIDARYGNGDRVSFVYAELQGVRGGASEGSSALMAYDPSTPPALRGHLYALAGYAEILLADLFCSDVPLSTIDFTGDYTYRAGSTSPQVYLDAIAKFDTAIALSGDSARILNLARVGKGRAWVDLGQYDSAAVAVADVPNSFQYTFPVDFANNGQGSGGALIQIDRYDNIDCQNCSISMANDEGGNGLPFVTSGDPRTANATITNGNGIAASLPNKYGGATPGVFPVTVADGIEARLIRAEAALHNPARWGSWLDTLNGLRATAPIPGTLQADPAALPPLSDPGTDTGRVTLLFRERAYWLFLAGHRQGDLRRLISRYNRLPNSVYPTGPYLATFPPTYGNAISLTIPSTESANPQFKQCQAGGL